MAEHVYLFFYLKKITEIFFGMKMHFKTKLTPSLPKDYALQFLLSLKKKSSHFASHDQQE